MQMHLFFQGVHKQIVDFLVNDVVTLGQVVEVVGNIHCSSPCECAAVMVKGVGALFYRSVRGGCTILGVVDFICVVMSTI